MLVPPDAPVDLHGHQIVNQRLRSVMTSDRDGRHAAHLLVVIEHVTKCLAPVTVRAAPRPTGMVIVTPPRRRAPQRPRAAHSRLTRTWPPRTVCAALRNRPFGIDRRY